MRPRTIRSLLLFALLPSSITHAHIGDEIYPFYELLDEDLHRIDLTDGSVEDWYDVLGEPSLTASDFVWGSPGAPAEYDPLDVDFRIWLAWHRGSGTLWAAMERVDDIYVNRYDGDPFNMVDWDSSIVLFVDGDHSGGRFTYVRPYFCEGCTAEQLQEDNRQAQMWIAIGEAPDGEHLLHIGAGREWVAREPYAGAGGGAFGDNPAISVTELRVTPFDDLVYDDEEASVASELHPGKVIGLDIWTRDNDDPSRSTVEWGIFMSLSESDMRSRAHADFFVDGLLLAAGEDPSLYDGDKDSAVEPSSWARIKAALRVRP